MRRVFLLALLLVQTFARHHVAHYDERELEEENPGGFRQLMRPFRPRGTIPRHALAVHTIPKVHGHRYKRPPPPSQLTDTTGPTYGASFNINWNVIPLTALAATVCETAFQDEDAAKIRKIDPDNPIFIKAGIFARMSDATYEGRTRHSDETNCQLIESKLMNDLASVDTMVDNVKVLHTYTSRETRTLMYTVTFTLNGKRAAALVFRGTVGELDGVNWRNNLDAYAVTEDGERSLGLWRSFTGVKPDIGTALAELLPFHNPDHLPGGLYFVGHSLGGALATFAADEGAQILSKHKGNKERIQKGWLQVYTFGEPREYTSKDYNPVSHPSEKLAKFRFIVSGDPVPSFPNAFALHAQEFSRAHRRTMTNDQDVDADDGSRCADFRHTGVPIVLRDESAEAVAQENYNGLGEVMAHFLRTKTLSLADPHSILTYIKLLSRKNESH